MSTTGIRKTLYLSKARDKDIITYITPLMESQDFSTVVRGLIRDGIQYRNPKHAQINREPELELNKNVIQSNNPSLSSSLQEVVLEKKPVSDQDIEARLDSF